MTAARNGIFPDAQVALPAPATVPTDAMAPYDAGDCPWTDCDAPAAAQRLQAGIWVEEILADVDSRR